MIVNACIVGARAETRDDQRVAASIQYGLDNVAPIEHAFFRVRHLFAPVLETDHPLPDEDRDRPVRAERHLAARIYHLSHLIRSVDTLNDTARVLERLRGALPHRELPRIELTPLAAHRNEHEH